MPPKSKSNLLLLLIDVGPSVRSSSEDTFFQQAERCLTNILQRKIFAEKCRDYVGVILFGTQQTKHNLDDGKQYQNILVFQKPRVVDWDMIAQVEHLPRGTAEADWLDALVVALDVIHSYGEDLFASRKIVLMTDFNTEFSDKQTEAIVKGILEMQVDLNVIGPALTNEDEPDSQMNWNGKTKTTRQLAGEMLIQKILSQVDGMVYSFDEAIPQLIFFEKMSQGSSGWNVKLTLGESLKIPVTGKIKIKQATPNTWKEVYAADETASIITETSFYRPSDEDQPVNPEDIIKGYQYGTTVVPFGDQDQQLKYESGAESAELSILGFTSATLPTLSLRSGDQVLVICARDHDEDAAVLLSAFIQALNQLDMVAIVRRIFRKNLNPVMGMLMPHITEDYECLLWIGLPYQEDVRNYAFPSLEKVEKRITDEESDLVDRLIDTMNLEPDGEPDEEFDPMHVVNPRLQYYFACLTQRAVSPDVPVPPPPQHILDILRPREEMLEKVSSLISEFKEKFPLEDRRKVKKGNMFQIEEDQAPEHSKGETSGTSRPQQPDESVTKITILTPAQDFMALLKSSEPNYHDICRQMDTVIMKLVDRLSENVQDNVLMEKIVSCLKVFRREGINIDPTPYNQFIKRLKTTIKDFCIESLWAAIKEENLGLISSNESLKSSHTDDQVQDFYASQSSKELDSQNTEMTDEDFEDLLDKL